MDTHWRVIYTASRQEKIVAKQLEKLGVVYYMPLVKKLREWSDRKKWVEVPLFHGYLFVKPDRKQRDEILPLMGVVKFLRYNNTDATVSDQDIDKIKLLIEKGYDLSEYNDDDVILLGDEVQITTGPMRGYEGEVVQIQGEYYAMMFFKNMGQSIKIKLPKQVLKRVEK
ncbi:MAG: UpxY family transcription antiterminator [Bacteroidia bacterium]